MENVQSYDRPLAYELAKSVAYPHDKQSKNQMQSNNTLKFTGAAETGDVIYDF